MKVRLNYPILNKIRSFGQSMSPILLNNDVVYLQKVNFSRIQVNDIITFWKKNRLFTHRVIYKNSATKSNYLITKGDNNLVSDGKVYPKQVLGKVIQVKRKGQIFNPEDIYLIQSSLYFQEIVKIKKALEKEKIDLLFLKGLPLHLYYEDSHPRRIYADCDVLVKPEHFVKIKKILIKNKYKLINSSYSDLHEKLKDKLTEVMFVKKINGFPVTFDVHFETNFLMNQLGELNALYSQKYINRLTDDVFETKKEIVIAKERFFILDSEYLILYLALHFFHHNFQGEYRLEFLDKIIKKSLLYPSPLGNPTLPATPGVFLALTEKILSYKLQNFVYPVFLLLKKYYNTPIPKNFLDQIKFQKDKINYIEKNILTVNIFVDESRIKAGITRFKNLLFLSSNPMWRKLMIFANLAVLYSIFWVIWRKIRRK